jgi:lipoprotein-anchoring transpeptidase ErfK/SrfK
MVKRNTLALLLMVAVTGTACDRGDRTEQRTLQPGDAGYVQDTQPQPGTMGQAQPGTAGQMTGAQDVRLEVSLAARELRVFRGGQQIETHPVAVGSEEWPTPTGEWSIGQVIWNPRWIPPQQEWAEDEETKEPGDPENPLGRAQLVYQAPNSIHGTNAPESLGQAVSHGSIRVSNEVALRLARMLSEAGGAGRDENWYRQAEQNRTERQELSLPNPIPIRVISGRT